MTSKQRAYLTGLSNSLDPIFHVGKDGVAPEMASAISDALEKRELIKVGVLKNCADDPNEVADRLAERTRSEVVRVIGKKIILYREAKKPKIVLP